MAGKMFFATGLFCLVLGGFHRLTLWAAYTPGIQWLYLLFIAILLLFCVFLVSNFGRNVLAQNTPISAFSWGFSGWLSLTALVVVLIAA